jgi:hypothetical protein
MTRYCNMHGHVTQQDRRSSSLVASRSTQRDRQAWLESCVDVVALAAGATFVDPIRRLRRKTAGRGSAVFDRVAPVVHEKTSRTAHTLAQQLQPPGSGSMA